jgi:O-antigen/teichoic acid export membrane protein
MESLYKKISGTFVIKLLGLGIAFLFQIIIGRFLEPEYYGLYTMFLTYTDIFLIISVLGMDRNLIKEIPKIIDDSLKGKSYLFFTMRVATILFLIISIFILIFHGALSISFNMLHLLLLMLLIKVFINLIDGYLQGNGLIVKVTFLNTLFNNFLKIILFFLLIFFEVDGLYSALLSFIGSEFLTLLLRLVIINKSIRIKGSGYNRLPVNESKTFLKYSITVSLISGVGVLLQNVDKIFIANYLSLSDVGIYKVAQNYVGLISVFVTPFIAFWPVISKLYSENKLVEIEYHMKSIVKIVTFLVVPMFFLFLFLNSKLLQVFGENYVTKEAQAVLIILAFAFLVDAISGPIGSILTMTKYAKFALINNLICLTINIILNVVLIKTYGITGVAIATAISIIIMNLIAIIEVKVLLGIFSYDFSNLIQICALAIINYFVCDFLINVIFINNIYLYIIIFGGLLYLLNIILLILYKKIFISRIF